MLSPDTDKNGDAKQKSSKHSRAKPGVKEAKKNESVTKKDTGDIRGSSASAKQKNFITQERVSEMEMQRRQTWLLRTRMSIASQKTRFRVTQEVKFPDNFNGCYCARFSANGEVFATSFGTGAIQVRNGETGELKTTLRSGLDTSFPVMCCRFNPIRKDVFYASSACGNIFMCTTDTNEFTRFIAEPKNEINTIDVSMGGDYLVSAGKDAAVRIYDADTAKLIKVYRKSEDDMVENRVTRFHRMRIFAARFHTSYPDLIVTGGWDDTVRIWDVRVDAGCIRTIKGPHICGDAIDIRESQLITGSWVVRGSLQVWDVMSAKLIETIHPKNRPTTLEGEFLYAVQYFDGDPYGEHVVVGGSGTGALEVISLKEKKVTGSLVVNKPIVTIDTCRTSILYAGMESVLRLADYS
ncbi:uncharacterized protein [Prorops nasuta]|uniref:uncharacterized protein n=1 Tax=Prorops nasuta TaxID=863751 RepID=UPI0034CEA338